MSNTLIAIPSRLAATRLPMKPLADIHGAPMIVHVWRRAMAAKVGRVIVATDAAEIRDVIAKVGGEAVMTRADHTNGSDRIHEAITAIDPQRTRRLCPRGSGAQASVREQENATRNLKNENYSL